ncbi:MAG: calcium/sodium antiporter [Cytophagaceae bacterium]
MIIAVLLLFLGLALLIKGADWLVSGASSLAKKYNVSDLAIGLTIVAFGTSAPELVVNVLASLENHQDIVFGNVIGSNNFNLFMILGIAGLITPLNVHSSTVWKEIPLSFVAVILVFFLVNDNTVSSQPYVLSRIDGLILLMLFGMFLTYVYSQLKSEPEDNQSAAETLPPFKQWTYIVIGFAGLVVGGELVVNNAVEIAAAIGISEKIIGLTVVAAGTSLPELATSVVAALKKNIDIAVGNVIGSNIFNLLFILSASAISNPITYDPAFNRELIILGIGTGLLFTAMFTGKKKKLDRWEAGVLLIFFVAYISYLVINA